MTSGRNRSIYNIMKTAAAEPKNKIRKTRLDCRLRRRKIIEACLEGKPLKETAIAVGLSPRSAATQLSHIISEPQVQQAFSLCLEEAGLSVKILAEKIKSLIDAEQTVFFQHMGRVTDQRIVPALETRRKSLEMTARLKGHLQESKSSVDVSINIMGAVVAALRRVPDE